MKIKDTILIYLMNKSFIHMISAVICVVRYYVICLILLMIPSSILFITQEVSENKKSTKLNCFEIIIVSIINEHSEISLQIVSEFNPMNS